MSQCHTSNLAIKKIAEEAGRRIVLVGNPNCGKSVFFNAFTGMYVDVSNYPGTTVDITYSRLGDDLIVDTPGVYGVSSFNDEERVTRDMVLEADTVINVVNATNLERDLFLTLQIADMGIPMIVALNMMDEAERNDIRIDVKGLAKFLGVPVIPTVAISGEGIDTVREHIPLAKVGAHDIDLTRKIEENQSKVENPREVLLLLEGDEDTIAKYGLTVTGNREQVYLARRARANDIIDKVVETKQKGSNVRKTISRIMVQPVTGIPILIGVLYLMYTIIGVWIAQDIVGITEETIMQGTWVPFITRLVARVLSPEGAVGQILVGEFGILTMTFTYVLGLLLPLVIGFYLILSIMEDSGYLPRIATLLDSSLSKLGLNGRAVIPMILGFGCVTMAAMTTRLLGSKRERTIAIALLGITIPCSAQLGVIAAMVAPLGIKLTTIYLVTVFAVFVAIGTILNKLLPGESTNLFIDLPPLRLPRVKNVLKKTWAKSYHFMLEAAPIFAIGAILLSVLKLTGALVAIQDVVAPITQGLLQLPKEASNAFIMGFVRRDFGAAGLYSMQLTDLQTLVALVVITLFVPCIASCLVFFKERGWKEGSAVWLGAFVIAFTVGGIVSHLLI